MSEENKPKKKFLQLKPEIIIATSAVLISLCALVISVMEIRLMREQQKVAVYPHLDIDYNYDSEGFSIFISNKGQGMAFVNNVQVWYQDRFFENWRDIADYFMPEGHQISYATYKTYTILEEILSPDETITLFNIPWTDDSRRFVEEFFPKLQMKVCYCSIMNECWVINSESNHPIKRDCEFNGKKQFY